MVMPRSEYWARLVSGRPQAASRQAASGTVVPPPPPSDAAGPGGAAEHRTADLKYLSSPTTGSLDTDADDSLVSTTDAAEVTTDFGHAVRDNAESSAAAAGTSDFVGDSTHDSTTIAVFKFTLDFRYAEA